MSEAPPTLSNSLKPVAPGASGAATQSSSNLTPISGNPHSAAPESAPPPVKAPAKVIAKQEPRKRTAIDTLVARDHTAVFWFVVACLIAAACAWYLVIMAEALKARPPFVVMDTAGAYYVAPGMNFDTMTPMHINLTQVAVETMFERGPLGLAKPARVSKLFNRKGKAELDELLKAEAAYFQSQKVEQTVELYQDADLKNLPVSVFPPEKVKRPKTNPAVLIALPTAVSTWATGIVTRRGVFKGQTQVELYRFKVIFAWKMNPDPRSNRAYPAVIDGIMSYNLEKISDL